MKKISSKIGLKKPQLNKVNIYIYNYIIYREKKK